MLTLDPSISALARIQHCRSFTVVLLVFMEKGQTVNESLHDCGDVM